MPRIQPIDRNEPPIDIKEAFEKHIRDYQGRITNMKATLGHSPLAFEVYMQWYSLYEEVKTILGGRLAYLFAHAISGGSNCPLCTTFFRRIIIENGEKPEDLSLTATEQDVLTFGSEMAQNHGQLPDSIYQRVSQNYTSKEMVILVAFAGQMIATNIFNNALEVEIDEYLAPYLPLKQTAPTNESK